MKIRCNATLISTLLLSLCLVTFIPDGLRDASTWKMPVIKLPCNGGIENYFMPMGFITLGIVAIGLIALWTGYRQRECRAWFVMLIILLCFVFPTDVLQLLVQMHVAGWRSSLEFLEEYWTVKGWWGCFMRPPLYVVGLKYVPIITVAMLLRFLVMLFALLLPVKAFFWKSYNPNVSDEQNGGLFVGDK